MLTFVLIYVFGGITFLPLVVIVLVGYTVLTSERLPPGHHTKRINGDDDGEKEAKSLKEPEKMKVQATIRRTFEPQPSEANTSYVSSLRSLLSSSPQLSSTTGIRLKESAWLVLKGTILYLYEDERCTEVMEVIDISRWDVQIYPCDGLLEGELYTKRNAIKLVPISPLSESPKGDVMETDSTIETEEPWYFFIPNLSAMESTYHTLLHSSQPTLPTSIGRIYNPDNVAKFISILDSTSDPLPTRWFNALLARVFFSYYRTAALEAGILAKINKKLGKIKRPSWLTSLHVPRVDIGNSPPMISKPMLKNLTADGEASVELSLSYKGDLRITVEATATFSFPGTAMSKARQYTVKLVLAVVLHSLQGNLLLLVRSPPSNRFWYAFTSAPEMKMTVEPVVSDRQIKWGLVLSTIESRLREVVMESVVLPNMDDIPFFNSAAEGLDYHRRGGMWGDAVRIDKTAAADPGDVEVKTPTALDHAAGELTHNSSMHTLASSDDEGPSTATSSSVASGTSGQSSVKRRNWFGSIGSKNELSSSPSKSEQPYSLARSTSSTSSTNDTEVSSPSTPTPRKEDDTHFPGGYHAFPTSKPQPIALSKAASTSSPNLPRQNKEDPARKSLELPSGVEKDDTDSNVHAPSISADMSRAKSAPADVAAFADADTTEEPKPDAESEDESGPGERGRTLSISSTSTSRSSRSLSSVASSSHSQDHSSAAESEDPDTEKQTQSNTRLNSQQNSVWSSFKNRNLLKEMNTKEGREMLGAQALGVVRKFGWKPKNPSSNESPSRSSGERERKDSTGSHVAPTSEDEVDGEERNGKQVPSSGSQGTRTRESYASLRDKAKERTGNTLSPYPGSQSMLNGGYLAPERSDPERERRVSLPSSTGLPAESSPSLSATQLSSSAPKTSSMQSPYQALSPPSPSTLPPPINRSQPSISQMPQMTIPGIHASRKGEIMSLSSEVSTAAQKGAAPPPLPPRPTERNPAQVPSDEKSSTEGEGGNPGSEARAKGTEEEESTPVASKAPLEPETTSRIPDTEVPVE